MSGILMASVGNSYGSAPVNTVAPVVSGTATVGQTLSTTNGTWLGAPAPTFTYQWQRGITNIGGATSSTYLLVAADYSFTVRCIVTATNSVAPSGVSAASNSTSIVAGTAPVNTVAPVVTGSATFGSTLSSTTGTWTGTPTPTFAYQWFRSPSTSISGASSSTYVLVAADVGNTIFCRVTGSNGLGDTNADSNTTATIAATVPGAPTIGTATATGATTATVAYTAPSSNGGSTITSYTATSSPGGLTGTLSQAGSGTITVTGLTVDTAYTFTVTATNAIGTGSASSASNSVTTRVTGQQAYTTVNTFSWVAPAGVTSVSVVTVGSQQNDGNTSYSGRGGALSYKNNISVTPGSSYTVVIRSGPDTTYFISEATVSAGSGSTRTGDGGGNGGTGNGGGGGAGGYTGSGGNGNQPTIVQTPYNSGSANGSSGGGGGGGGGGGYYMMNSDASDYEYYGATGGGGVGLLGQGASGAGGSCGSSGGSGGGGGSGGTAGDGSSGQNYGTGFAGGPYGGGSTYFASNGTQGSGAVRIIWPGASRSFPSTNTGNL